MRRFNIIKLQWLVGVFLQLLGAIMLVTPHQFSFLLKDAFKPYLFYVGIGLLIIGFGLVAIRVFQLSTRFTRIVHLFGGGLLLTLSAGFIVSGAWIYGLDFLLISIGLLLAPFIPHTTFARPQSTPDLLSFILGSTAALNGVVLLAYPEEFSAPHYSLLQQQTFDFGLAMLFAGLLLVVHQFIQIEKDKSFVYWTNRFAQILFAGVFFVFTYAALPGRLWPAYAFFGFFGVSILLLPWLFPRHRDLFTPTLLHVRLAFIFAFMTTVPLILTVAIISNHEENLVRKETLSRLEIRADYLSKSVAEYINLHRSGLQTLANQPGLMELSPTEQRRLLFNYEQSYPGVTSFTLYNAAGNPLVSTNYEMLKQPLAGYPNFENPRRTGFASMDILFLPSLYRPVFDFSMPVLTEEGRFNGLVTFGLYSAHLADLITEQSDEASKLAYIVDEKGRVVVHINEDLVATFADFSTVPSVEKALDADQDFGSMIYNGQNGRRLAAYSHVQGNDLVVIVERSESISLANVHASREMALIILLGFLVVAIAGGSWLAGRVTSPLHGLAKAVRELAADNPSAPLPYSSIPEVKTLADAFGDMRAKLGVQTRERELARKALEEQQLLLQTVLAQAANGIIVCDAKGKVTFINQAAKKFLDQSGDDSVRVGVASLGQAHGPDGNELSPDDWPIRRALRGETITGQELYFVNHQRVHADALVSAAPLKRNDGPILGAVAVLTDITPRKLAEEELRRTKEGLEVRVAERTEALREAVTEAEERAAETEAVFNALSEAVIVYDTNGVVVHANPFTIQLFGFDPTHLNEETVYQRLRLETMDGLLLALEQLPSLRALRGESLLNETFKLTNIQGALFTVQVSTSSMQVGGELVGSVSVWHDVTEREELLTRLEFEQTRLKTIMNSAPAGIIHVDREGKILLANPTAHALLGGEISGDAYGPTSGYTFYRSDGSLFAPEELPLPISLRTGEPCEGIDLFVKFDSGDEIVVLVNTSPIKDAQGRINGAVAVLQNITELVQIQRALQESEARFRLLVESMEDVIFTLDLEQRVTGIFGRSASKFVAQGKSWIGKLPEEIADSQTAALYRQAIMEALSGETLVYEWSDHQLEGKVNFQTQLSPIRNERGKITGLVGVSRDISELKQARAELEHYAAQLERSNRELEQFAFVASHDLQEPMRKIKAFGERLMSQMNGDGNEIQLDFLMRMIKATGRMQDMIEGLLVYSRVTTKAQPFQQVELQNVFGEVVSDLEIQIERSGGSVELVTHLPVIQADPLQMRQLFQNLIGNALKFHPPDQAPMVKVSCQMNRSNPSTTNHKNTTAGRQVVISVEDNGIGFESEHHERIFRPFERLRGRSEYEGTGMGLAICYKIVERHKGEIQVESTPNLGSKFSVVLPVAHSSDE